MKVRSNSDCPPKFTISSIRRSAFSENLRFFQSMISRIGSSPIVPWGMFVFLVRIFPRHELRSWLESKEAGVSVHVLVTSAGEIEDDEVIFLELWQTLDETGDGVGGFERGNDPFNARDQARGIQGSLVGNGGIFSAALIGEPGVFGADSGIVETCGNGMCCCDLAVLVLQNVSVSSLKYAGARSGKTLMRGEAGGMFAKFAAAAARFDTNHFHIRIAQKIVKEPDGIRATANARKKMCGQTLFSGKDLLACFSADDRLKITHHRGVRMRTENRAKKIVRASHIGDPIAHRFVDGIFERAAAGPDADNLRAKHAHARHVERLPRHVFRAHVDDAFETKLRRDCSGSDSVLACARFRDDARLAHFHG